MINKVILIGNVGADPEVRTLESGVKVARVRLATTERIYNRQTQEAREHTEWHTVTLWRNMADTADRFVRKGSQIYVEGRIRSNEWTDQNGAKRYGIEILADDIKLLGRRSDSPAGQQPGAPQGGGYGQQGAGAPGFGGAPAAGGSAGGFAGAAAAAPGFGGAPAAGAAPDLPSPQDDIDDLPF